MGAVRPSHASDHDTSLAYEPPLTETSEDTQGECGGDGGDGGGRGGAIGGAGGAAPQLTATCASTYEQVSRAATVTEAAPLY